MKKWARVEVGFMISISLGLPLSFVLGYSLNSKLNLLTLDYSSYAGKFYASNIGAGLIASLLLMIIVFIIMNILSKVYDQTE